MEVRFKMAPRTPAMEKLKPPQSMDDTNSEETIPPAGDTEETIPHGERVCEAWYTTGVDGTGWCRWTGGCTEDWVDGVGERVGRCETKSYTWPSEGRVPWLPFRVHG